jgi:N-acetyl-alpha-D-muramate 1-phosphate uridylyltransferase
MPPVVILAGGLATRLYPVTKKIPKSLIEIGGRPFIDHQLSLISKKGISQVVLCVGYLGEMIEDFVKDGSRWGLEVRYSYDGDTLLGTGGAIKKAASMLPESFLILYGDSYLDIDFGLVMQHFYTMNMPVLMTVYRNENVADKSNIIMRGGKIIKYDKKYPDPSMQYIDYGLIVISRKIFDKYPANKPFDLSLVLSQSVDAGLVAPFEVKQRFFEIGSVQGIRETEDYIRNHILPSYN